MEQFLRGFLVKTYGFNELDEKEIVDNLIEYYIELKEHIQMLELNKKNIEAVVSKYMSSNQIDKIYDTAFVQVKLINKKDSSNKYKINKLIEASIKEDISEVLSVKETKNLVEFLAPFVDEFEVFRKYKVNIDKNKNIKRLKEFIISKKRFDLLKFDKLILLNMLNRTLAYNENQNILLQEILKELDSKEVVIKRKKI